ncbi:hypothetical protein Tco_0951220 [Tanacetum coccineum]|uniref:Retrovirus-related Pol polyprotein from transposon TNT 1-94-like beta-barrel domain-containing protein n=1 Tax=Tanacetum coccineum TaxID=301880 RepID=A0ABQ5DTY1_9ASTR
MTGTSLTSKKFDGTNDFVLWQKKTYNTLILCLGDRVLREITKETTATGIWKMLETLFMTKSLVNRLYLKKKLYTFHMHPGKSQYEYIDEFHKLVGDLAAIDTAISDEDQAFLLFTSLSSSYDNFMETLLHGRDTLKLEDVLAILNSRELQKMTKAKGDGGKGLYARRRSGQRDMEQGTYNAYNHKKSQGFVKNEDQVFGFGADGYDNADVMMAMSIEELLDWIMDSGISYYITSRRDYLVDFEKYDGDNILLSDGRECRVRGTVTRKTLKGRKQLGEYQTGWKIKTGYGLVFVIRGLHNNVRRSGLSKVFWVEDTTMSTYLVNRSPSLAIGFKTPVDMLGFFCWLAIKQWMLEPVKEYGFNESGEYKKTFIGSGVGTGSVHVLQGVEFEVEPQEDHTFKVEPHRNVDHVVGSQEVQTQDLIYYHPARDREQYSSWELFSYREDSNEAAFAVAAVDKVYAHESLTFNYTVACEVIFKWKARLKDDIDARSDVYVLSNGCRRCSDDSNGYYWKYTPGLLDKAMENVLGMEIVRDQSSNTLRVSQSRFYNGKLEYQVVCTRLDIASADVGMLDKFDRGLHTDVQVFVDLDYTMGRSITVIVS